MATITLPALLVWRGANDQINDINKKPDDLVIDSVSARRSKLQTIKNMANLVTLSQSIPQFIQLTEEDVELFYPRLKNEIEKR